MARGESEGLEKKFKRERIKRIRRSLQYFLEITHKPCYKLINIEFFKIY